MRRIVRGLLAVAALAVFSSCSDSSGPNGGAFVGTYALISVNGQNVPAVIYADQFVTFRITSGSVTLNSNNTFSTSGTLQQTPVIGASTTFTETCTGTFVVSGSTITFIESGSTSSFCSGSYDGTWDGSNTLTVALDPALQAVFRK